MGSYVISVSLGTGCYRHIQISENATLLKLSDAILEAFQFDNDHQHAFFMDNKYWSDRRAYFSTRSEPGERVSRSIKLEKLRLNKGAQFKYLFDFGDEWRFQCKVLRYIDDYTKVPIVVRSVGEAPEQYPSWDEEWEEDEEWDDELDDDEDDLIAYAEGDSAEDEIDFFPEILPQPVIQSLFKELPISANAIRTIHLYFSAAARLYSMIPVCLLMDIYNTQNKPIATDVFLTLASIMRHEENNFVILSAEMEENPDAVSFDMMVVNPYLLAEGEGEVIMEIVKVQGDTPYYVPPKKELLKYGDHSYFPTTTESEALLQYLSDKKKHHNPKEVCLDIQAMCEAGLSTDEILDLICTYGVRFAKGNDRNTFGSLIDNLNNHTRKPIYRGATPDELKTIPKNDHPLYFKPDIEGQITLFDEY